MKALTTEQQVARLTELIQSNGDKSQISVLRRRLRSKGLLPAHLEAKAENAPIPGNDIAILLIRASGHYFNEHPDAKEWRLKSIDILRLLKMEMHQWDRVLLGLENLRRAEMIRREGEEWVFDSM